MIQVGSSDRTHGSPAATDSSPMNLPHARAHTLVKINTDRNTNLSDSLEEELGGAGFKKLGGAWRGRGFKEEELEQGGGASYLCVGNFSFTDWMMSCSTFWSVCVTRSTEELLVITFLSSSRASRTT